MSNQVVETVNEAGQAAVEAVKAVVAVNTAAVEALVAKQFEIATQVVEMTVAQAKLVLGAKDTRSAFEAQVALFEKAAGLALDHARDFAEIANSTGSQYSKLVDKNVKSAVAAINKAPTKKAA